MYQCENGNDLFDSFIDTFEKIVEKHAPIQTVTGIWVFIRRLEQKNSKLDRMSKQILEWTRLFFNAYKNEIGYHNDFGWQK